MHHTVISKMSHTCTIDKTSRASLQTGQRNRLPQKVSSKKSTELTDHDNLDDFFRQPSAHELSVVDHLSSTIESRVSEIIADLQRQTSEELEWWSACTKRSLSVEQNNSEELTAAARSTDVSLSSSTSPSTSNRRFAQTNCDATFLPGSSLVSSPISFLSPSFPYLRNLKLSTSNIVPVIKSKISVRRPRPVDHFSSPSQSRCVPGQHNFDTSMPRRQPQPKQNDEHRILRRNGEVCPIKPSFQSFLKRVPKPPSRHKSVNTGSPATVSRQTTLTMRTIPRSELSSGHDRFSFEPEERAQETNATSQSSTPRRKPLPKDSPLLIPLSRHPAFAKASYSCERLQEEDMKTTDGVMDKTHKLEHEARLMSPLLPLPSSAASPS